MTPLSRSSKLGQYLLGLLGLVALTLLGACSTGPTTIGVGLPTVDANTGAYLLDTLTVRASTVLRDSVVTSTSSYLLVGRANDPLLGTLTAKSFCQLGLGGSFTPAATLQLDSVALELSTGSVSYRYGDTTKTQALARVYRLNRQLPTQGVLYAKKALTPLDSYYDATALLNKDNIVRVRRASPGLRTIHIPLKREVGLPLFAAGQAGQLTTNDQLLALLPGLVIAPDDNDQGALVRLDATSSDAGLKLYYHNPAEINNPLTVTFSLANGGRHCFQVERAGNASVTLPTTSLVQKVYAEQAGQQTFVQGALGLQTRLEFPYLQNLNQLGQRLTITSAQLVAQVPPTTLTPFLPTPPTLNVSTSNLRNQPVLSLASLSYATDNGPTVPQGSYTYSLTSYVQAVLAGTIANNGLLLSSSTPELPTRVVLGGPRNTTNKLQLRLYLIQTQ